MSHLDDELRIALKREEPPEGFVNRVLERLPAEPSQAIDTRPSVARTWLAAAAALVLAAGAIWTAIPRAPEQYVTGVVGPKPEVPPTSPAPQPPPQPQPAPQPPPKVDPQPAQAPQKRAPRLQPRRVRDDAEAIHAAEQLRTALGVTSDKFRLAQRQVREALVVPES